MPDLIHWHHGGTLPDRQAEPPKCCARKFDAVLAGADRDHSRRLDGAVHAERVRVVTEALAAIETYADAAASVLTAEFASVVETAAAKCAEAIRKVGCICPRIEISTFGGSTRFVPGRDPRCGLHDIGFAKTNEEA